MKKERISEEISSAGARVFETVSSCNPAEQIILAIGVIAWLKIGGNFLKNHNFEPEKSK